MNKKIYTFEDWNTGNIVPTKFPEDERLSRYELSTKLSAGIANDLPLALYMLDRMQKKDFRKVRDKQKKAYKILLQYHVNQAKKKIKDFDDPTKQERYLIRRKEFIEHTFQKEDQDLYNKMLDAGWDKGFFRSNIVNKILRRHEEGDHQYSYNRKKARGEVKKRYRVGKLFELRVLYEELQTIEEFSKQRSKKVKSPAERPSIKKGKSFKLRPYLNNIIEAGDHSTAIKEIKNEFSDFSWDRPNKQMFFKHREGINKKQVSYALEKIAKKKWPDTYPSAETIKKHLLK